MRQNRFLITILIFIGVIFAYNLVNAQQTQIPTLQTCNKTLVEGKAIVKIANRSGPGIDGIFKVRIKVQCDPSSYGDPVGEIEIGIDMTDTSISSMHATDTFFQLTSMGKHSPTAFLSGRCVADKLRGCKFWIMLVDNTVEYKSGTPDIIGFYVIDGKGKRLAHGTGPVVEGNIKILPSGE